MLSRAQRDGFYRARAIEIGDEPPLRLHGESGTPGDSRQVNIRWFSGTILAGFLGIGLLGAAIHTSMDGAYNFAKAPGAIARWDPYGGRVRSSNTNRKADRIALGKPVEESRQVFRVSTTVKSGDREVVRTRPVTRIMASLVPTGLNADIPAFNPLAMFNEDETPAEGEAAPSADGDISYVVQSLAGMNLKPDDGPSVALEDVLASVRDVAAINSLHGSDLQNGEALAFAGGTGAAGMGYAPGAPAPNMTVLVKTAPKAQAGNPSEDERVVVARGNERLDDILIRQGATAEEAREISAAFGSSSGYGTMALMAGQTVKILMSPGVGRSQPVRVIVLSGTTESIVALSDTGGYVAVADAPEIAEEGEPLGDTETDVAGGVRPQPLSKPLRHGAHEGRAEAGDRRTRPGVRL